MLKKNLTQLKGTVVVTRNEINSLHNQNQGFQIHTVVNRICHAINESIILLNIISSINNKNIVILIITGLDFFNKKDKQRAENMSDMCTLYNVHS